MQSISIEKITERADRMDLLYDKGNRINYLKAIEKRVSRRAYLNQKIEADKLERIREAIRHYNKLSGLSIQLIEDGSQAFKWPEEKLRDVLWCKNFNCSGGKNSRSAYKRKGWVFWGVTYPGSNSFGTGNLFCRSQL